MHEANTISIMATLRGIFRLALIFSKLFVHFIATSVPSFYIADFVTWCLVKHKYLSELYEILSYKQYRRLRTQYEYFLEMYRFSTKDELEDELRIVNSHLQTINILSVSSFYLSIVLTIYQLYTGKVEALGIVTGLYFAIGRFIQLLTTQQQAIERCIQIAKENESTW